MTDLLVHLLTLLGGFAALIVGAEVLIRGALKISSKLGLSKAFTGAVLLGFGTSAPELFTSLVSASQGEGILAAGNVVGSNIFNSTLVMSCCLFLFAPKARKSIPYLKVLWLILPAFLVFAFFMDSRLTLVEGIAFLSPLPFFLWFIGEADEESEEDSSSGPYSLALGLGLLLLGLGGLYFGAKITIQGALGVSDFFGLSKEFAGAIILAAGTGLPELATSIIAGIRKEGTLAVGNIIGSNALNVFGVLGLSATLFPFELSREMASKEPYFLLLVSSLLVATLFLRRRSFRVALGILFISLYVIYFQQSL